VTATGAFAVVTVHRDFLEHASHKNLFVQDLFAGAAEAHRIGVRVYCEYAWHALFISHLLLVPAREQLNRFAPQLTIIDLGPGDPSPARYLV